MNILKQPAWITKKTAIILFAGLLFSGTLLSQDDKVDILTLKNGSIIKGRLIEMTDSNKVSIETLCQNTWVFSLDEIERMECNQSLSLATGPNSGSRYSTGLGKRSGFYSVSSPGLLFASGNNDKNTIFSLQMTGGYQLQSRYFAGIGTGLEFFQYSQLPLFLDVSYLLTEGTVSPFIVLRGGYSFALEDPPDNDWITYQGKGGYLWGAGLGIVIPLGQKNALSCSILYRYQDVTVINTTLWNDEVTEITTEYNRLSVRLGIMFY